MDAESQRAEKMKNTLSVLDLVSGSLKVLMSEQVQFGHAILDVLTISRERARDAKMDGKLAWGAELEININANEFTHNVLCVSLNHCT